jgi:hypothetical protein
MFKQAITICLLSLLLITGCAMFGNNNNQPATTSQTSSSYAQDPDNPTVGSRAASNEEFPQENQLTPPKNQQ